MRTRQEPQSRAAQPTIYLDPDLALLLDTGPEGNLTLDATSSLRRLQSAGSLVMLPGGSAVEAGRRFDAAGIDFCRQTSAPAGEVPVGSFAVSDDPAFFAPFEGTPLLPVYILSPKGLPKLDRISPDTLAFHTLKAAADWISAHTEGTAYLTQAIDSGAEALCRGELTAFPTETVYGLGANALSQEAVGRIFRAKKRPFYDPLIVHIGDIRQLDPLVSELPESASKLADRFWPGPLTLVLPKSELVPDLVTAGHPTVAVRMPANPWARELIIKAGLPVAAPSANLFGRTSPTTAAHVADQLAGSYAVLIDAGACRVGVESTVLSLAGPTPRLLRSGGISREEIESVIGPVETVPFSDATAEESPGMLPSHYAPLTPLKIVEDIAAFAEISDTGCILYEKSAIEFAGPTELVSARRDVREIAVNLYAALRNLDSQGLRQIVAEWCPETGVGAAVNDRLRKASAGQ